MSFGVASPEGVVVADAGCQHFQSDLHLGGTTAIVWIKLPGQDGTANGWTPFVVWSL